MLSEKWLQEAAAELNVQILKAGPYLLHQMGLQEPEYCKRWIKRFPWSGTSPAAEKRHHTWSNEALMLDSQVQRWLDIDEGG